MIEEGKGLLCTIIQTYEKPCFKIVARINSIALTWTFSRFQFDNLYIITFRRSQFTRHSWRTFFLFIRYVNY